jgi:hypothetical protein
MSDFLNSALNASDCTASAVATPVSRLHVQCSQCLRLYSVSSSYSCQSAPCTNRKDRKGENCARRLWFKRHEMCSHFSSLNTRTFSDFPGMHDSHRFQQLKFSLCGCQPAAQSANVGGKTRDNKDEWRQWSPRIIPCSRQAWPTNAYGLKTLSLLEYLAKVTLHYTG